MKNKDYGNEMSIVIPSYNTPKKHLETLLTSLLKQSFKHFEVIIVDDYSDFNFYEIIKDERFKIIYKNYNSGPAECRNIGSEHAKGNFIFFTDSDCKLAPDTLKTVMECIDKEDLVMGNTITKARSFFGKAVALLGFPGGGILGFDKVWKVDKDGYADSISSCNFSIKKNVFFDLGKFDPSFPVPGGEDTLFAKIAINKGYKIRYLPTQIVYHVERSTFKSFIKWQIVRGRGNFYIKKKLGNVKGFLKLRLWSFKNSLKNAGLIYAPLVFVLILLSVYYQTRGYNMEKSKKKWT
jgi:glycosyltransferase involved in cell wall biosynthesis